MTELAQAVVNGLQMGFLYALVAVGLTIIWGLMEMINFAHGEFLMLGMFGAWWLSASVGLDPLLAIVPIGLVMFAFGVLVYRYLMRRVQGGDPFTQIFATIGLLFLLQNAVVAGFTSDYRFVEGKVAGVTTLVSRTGYTGEDGFELYVGAGDTERLWNALLETGRADGVAPIGLGARDTLRLEMRYALYGNDIDESTNPLEAGLGWVVKPAKGDFLGREAIERLRAAGLARRLVGIEMTERAVARHGYPVVKDGVTTGVVTSGSYGPSVDRYIAMAYVGSAHAAVGTELGVEIRGQVKSARVVKTPFHTSRVKKG